MVHATVARYLGQPVGFFSQDAGVVAVEQATLRQRQERVFSSSVVRPLVISAYVVVLFCQPKCTTSCRCFLRGNGGEDSLFFAALICRRWCGQGLKVGNLELAREAENVPHGG